MQPMLATPASRVPTGPLWMHEVKWDGMRIVLARHGGETRLFTRTGARAEDRFPELSDLDWLGSDVVLDGEVIALDGGKPSFPALSERIHVRDRAAALRLASQRPISYVAFDLLHQGGQSLLPLPWSQRRERLTALPDRAGPLLIPDVYPDGPALFAATLAQGLEGVVSKRIDARYYPGERSSSWVKVAHRPTLSVLVGGFRRQTGSTTRIGSLLVGRPGPHGVAFIGRVGSGISASISDRLRTLLEPRVAADPPFVDALPAVDREGTVWVDPQLVVDVRSLGLAGQGRLRQPSFAAIRVDLNPADLNPADLNPAGLNPADLNPADLNPADLNPAETGPDARGGTT